jgi:hypothetical protein
MIASDHGENMVTIHHLLNSDEFLYERTLGTFFLLLPKYYHKPVNNFSLEEYIDDIYIEEETEEEERDEDWSIWRGGDGFRRRGYFLDRNYYHLTSQPSCSTKDKDKYVKNIKKEKEKKYDYNIFNSAYSQKQLKVYQDIKEFNEKYYLNRNKKEDKIKDDYSYDIEKVIFEDEEFYIPYNQTALEINQHRFITPYDIHDTLVYLVANDYYWKSKKGQTLTDEIDGLKRNCSFYDEDFDNLTIKEYCYCINFK